MMRYNKRWISFILIADFIHVLSIAFTSLIKIPAGLLFALVKLAMLKSLWPCRAREERSNRFTGLEISSIPAPEGRTEVFLLLKRRFPVITLDVCQRHLGSVIPRMKKVKLFYSIFRPNFDGCKHSIHDLKALAEPTNFVSTQENIKLIGDHACFWEDISRHFVLAADRLSSPAHCVRVYADVQSSAYAGQAIICISIVNTNSAFSMMWFFLASLMSLLRLFGHHCA